MKKKHPKAEHLRDYVKTAHLGDDDEIAGFLSDKADVIDQLEVENAALKAKLLAVEGLPEMWRSLNESRHDPNNAIRCASELEAALEQKP